jgi:hypothetical protein
MYVERIPGPRSLRILGVVASVIMAGGAISLVQAVAVGWGGPQTALLLVYLLVLLGVVGLAALSGLLNRITIRIAEGQVCGYLAPFRVFRLSVDDILDVRQTEVSARDAGGIGYRWTPGRRFLLFEQGTAVELRVREGRIYVLRTNHPGELAEVIRKAQSLDVCAIE